MKLQQNKIIILSTVLLFIITISAAVFAADLSLEEAVGKGLANSNEIKEAKESVDKLKRQLDRISAQQDWQVDLDAAYSHYFLEKNTTTVPGSESSKNMSISASKTYPSRLYLNTEMGISEEDQTPDASVNISYPVFPSLSGELARNYYLKQKSILKAEMKLIDQTAGIVLSWLESYLKYTRLLEKYEVYLETVEKAENNLKVVEQRMEIGDAGKNQLLTARLSLENAKYMLEEAENQIEDARYTLVNSLGLSGDEIIVTDKSQFIDRLRQKAFEITTDYLKVQDMVNKEIEDSTFNRLISIVKCNNYELQANLIDLEILFQELNWLKKEARADLNLNGSYNTDDELKVGLNLSYSLYDGGLYKEQLTEKELEIEDNKSNYDDIYNQLNQVLKQHIDQIRLSQMAFVKEKLNLEKSQYELEVAEKQLEVGLIDYLEYQEYWISAAELKIDLKSLEDQLFIDRLEFVKFINPENIALIIGGF